MEGDAQARKHMLALTESQRRLAREKEAADEGRREMLFKKIRARMVNGTLLRCLTTWRDDVQEARR
jgi:hypothetical protein